jgi:pyruvate carboxylase subunit B
MVELHEQILRDAHQSVLATRMRTEDMLPICDKLNQVGFWSMEVWGGATFDVPIRYLNEDPWERLKTLKEHLPDTPLQMLERAMNIVAYWNFPDDVVKAFIKYAKQDGCDYFRIFDALNDLRNMKVPIENVLEVGGHAQGCISYTISPVHTVEHYVEQLRELEKLGCQSVCIKDMAGMISPKRAYDIVSGYKEAGGKAPIDLHSHCTSGMTGMAFWAACDAGIDILDTAISPISGGTGGMPTESVVAALQETEYDTKYDLELLIEIRKYFMGIWHKYRHLHRQEAMKVDPSVTVHQIPGGMLSNLVSQLEAQGAADKYQEVLDETAKVREELGYPPLVTPTSQVVGVQAVMNVLFGRYKKVPKETEDYCRGLYGKPPGEIKPEIMEAVLGPNWEDEVITCRPADLVEPMMKKAEEELNELGLIKKPEDVITYAIYDKVALKFLKGEAVPEFTSDQLPLDKDHPMTRAMVKAQFPELPDVYLEVEPPEKRQVAGPAPIPTEFNVEVDGEFFEVKVEPTGGFIMAGGGAAPRDAGPPKDIEGAQKTGMQGTILKLLIKVGDKVEVDTPLAVIEAMKMEQEITADIAGEVKEIFITEGCSVKTGDVIMQIL